MSKELGNNEELIAQRYGRNSSNSWRYIAALLLLTGFPYLIWSAWHHSNPEIRITLISFQNEQEASIDITYLVQRRDPSLALNCTLIARDIDKNVVGEVEVVIPGSDQDSVKRSDSIPTRLKAVNASVLKCYAADAKGK